MQIKTKNEPNIDLTLGTITIFILLSNSFG